MGGPGAGNGQWTPLWSPGCQAGISWPRGPVHEREMVDREHPSLPIVGQCALLGVSRSSIYYQGGSEEDLSLMREIDRQYLATPFYTADAGTGRQGFPVSRKRVQRDAGHGAAGHPNVYPRPGLGRPHLPAHGPGIPLSWWRPSGRGPTLLRQVHLMDRGRPQYRPRDSPARNSPITGPPVWRGRYQHLRFR